MSPLAFLLVFSCLSPVTLLDELIPAHAVPRKTVHYPDDSVRMFREEGFWNYSSMLLSEDLGLLLVGAREAVYALKLQNISERISKVSWSVSQKEQELCINKGKSDVDCRNYIRVLHETKGGQMYVCGTNAFVPTCDHMSFEGGQLLLADQKEDGKGKCPFDPHYRHASLMTDGDLYSASTLNFLGSQPVLTRNSGSTLRTDHTATWLNEPRFVSMEEVPESSGSPTGDDDKVYLFFSEAAVEYDFSSKLVVSRVARVCKGDLGGQRTLQRKWTSFLKAQLDCPVLDFILPFVVQDVFLWRDTDWRTSVFYAVFTPQSGSTDLSAVCAYRVDAMGEVFSKGKYKTPVTVETAYTKWVMYGGEVPVPRPGACIDDAARQMGINKSLELPDKTLQFVQMRPLMDAVVQPLGGRPQLVTQGPALTRIAVDKVTALDGGQHAVLFVGTEIGFVQKAVNYDGEMFIIEELQLFSDPVPIEVLRLSVTMGFLYVGSAHGAVQVPLSRCDQYQVCSDCLLARDPYCAWDTVEPGCTPVKDVGDVRHLIQSLGDGDATKCPDSGSIMPTNVTLVPGNAVKLLCQRGSNLAQTLWLRDGQPLEATPGIHVHSDGLLLSGDPSVGGLYKCQSVERVSGRSYITTGAVYRVLPDEVAPPPAPPSVEAQRMGDFSTVLQFLVALLCVMLVALLTWNVYRGHIPLCRRTQPPPEQECLSAGGLSEVKLLVNSSSNNNHCNVTFGSGVPSPTRADLPSLVTIQAIGDESEI